MIKIYSNDAVSKDYIYKEKKKDKNENNKTNSKLLTFIRSHPLLFSLLIVGITMIIIIVIVLYFLLIKNNENNENKEKDIINYKDHENNQEKSEEYRIFPLKEGLKLEVMEIYNSINNNDKGTLEQFCDFLSEKASNLKDEQKVYLVYYWITQNIKYDYDGYYAGIYECNPEKFFQSKTTVCSGYSRLFRRLLISMNYTENNIANIQGYARGLRFSKTHELKIDHEWNDY